MSEPPPLLSHWERLGECAKHSARARSSASARCQNRLLSFPTGRGWVRVRSIAGGPLLRQPSVSTTCGSGWVIVRFSGRLKNSPVPIRRDWDHDYQFERKPALAGDRLNVRCLSAFETRDEYNTYRAWLRQLSSSLDYIGKQRRSVLDLAV
jgi:hypothetical protein